LTRQEFTSLRDCAKTITDDIFFKASEIRDILELNELVVENEFGLELVLTGSYTPAIPTVTFNFSIGREPICRVEVNGNVHRDAGRTHKHELRNENCSRQNLPTAFARPELENKSTKEIWKKLCEMANITHTGDFFAPEDN
jgi:hypothetical protein